MTLAHLRDALALTVGFIGGASVAWAACVAYQFTTLPTQPRTDLAAHT